MLIEQLSWRCTLMFGTQWLWRFVETKYQDPNTKAHLYVIHEHIYTQLTLTCNRPPTQWDFNITNKCPRKEAVFKPEPNPAFTVDWKFATLICIKAVYPVKMQTALRCTFHVKLNIMSYLPCLNLAWMSVRKKNNWRLKSERKVGRGRALPLRGDSGEEARDVMASTGSWHCPRQAIGLWPQRPGFLGCHCSVL